MRIGVVDAQQVAAKTTCTTADLLLYGLPTEQLLLHPKEKRMQRTMSFRRGLGVLAAIVTLAVVGPAYAQTQGMERRDDRRGDRAGGRAAKQACKAGDEKSRAECRQVKHTTKHGGGEVKANEAPATKPVQ